MKRIICIIDMQRDFIEGSLGSLEAQTATRNAVNWLIENLHEDDTVFLTKDTHSKDYLETPEGKRLPIKHCIRGSDGWRIWPALLEVIEDSNIEEIFHKCTFGCRELVDRIVDYIIDYVFYKSNDKDVEIIFMGLDTDICIISNVLLMKEALGNELDIPIKVLSNCCAGTTPEKHAAALEVMKSCQIDVI